MKIDELYTKYMEDNYHEMLHKVISSYKHTCPIKSHSSVEDFI